MGASTPTSKGPFAIMRMEKIKTIASLERRCRHIDRTQPVENSDPDAGGIVVLTGSDDPAADAKQILATLDRPPRKNAVLAIEVFMGASPEWWKTGDLDAFCKNAVAWLDATYGPGRTAHVCLHLDEGHPHCAAIVIPWVDTVVNRRGRKPKSGANQPPKACRRLDCAGLVGTSKEALRNQQTTFAAAMAGIGLKRGIEGSNAVHTRTAVWKGQQRAAAEAAAVREAKAREAETFAMLAAQAANADRKSAAMERAEAAIDRRAAAGERQQATAWSKGIAAVAAGELVDAVEDGSGSRQPVFAASVAPARRQEIKADIASVWQRFGLWLAALAEQIRAATAKAQRDAVAVVDATRMRALVRSHLQEHGNKGEREWSRQITR